MFSSAWRWPYEWPKHVSDTMQYNYVHETKQLLLVFYCILYIVKKCEHFKEAYTWATCSESWSHSHQWFVLEVQVTILHSTHGLAQYHKSFSLVCRYYLRGKEGLTLRSVRPTIQFPSNAEVKFINRLGYDPTCGTSSMYVLEWFNIHYESAVKSTWATHDKEAWSVFAALKRYSSTLLPPKNPFMLLRLVTFEAPFMDPHCNIYLSNLCSPFTNIFILFLKFYLVWTRHFHPTYWKHGRTKG